MRLATLTSLPIDVLGVIILPDSMEGSHFSSQILMLLPSPTTHLAPSLITGLAATILLHILLSCAGEDEAWYCRPTPGVTQDIAGYKIGHRPSIYVLETPDVLVPSIPDIETELKLALAGSVKDSMVGEERIAQYLLAFLNTQGTPLHWKHLISRKLEGIRYDSKKNMSIIFKNKCLNILIHGFLNFIHKNVVRVVYM